MLIPSWESPALQHGQHILFSDTSLECLFCIVGLDEDLVLCLVFGSVLFPETETTDLFGYLSHLITYSGCFALTT